MGAYKNMLKSKTPWEALRILPLSFFDRASFILLSLFALMPLLSLIKEKLFPFPFLDWRSYNRSVLIIGSALLLLYILKLKAEGIPIKPLLFLKNNIPIALFGVFALLMLISTAVNGFTTISLLGTPFRAEGFIGYLGYIVYFLLSVLLKSEKLKRGWLYLFSAVSAVLEIYTVIGFYLTGKISDELVFVHFNHYGYYLMVSFAVNAMLIVISDKPLRKLLFSAAALLSGLALIICDTFGCQLSAIVGLVFIVAVYSIAKGRFALKTLIPIGVFLLSFVLAAFSSPILSEAIGKNFHQVEYDVSVISGDNEEEEFSTGVTRMILWENTLRYIGERPIFGFGADETSDRLYVDSNYDTDRCHCEYMNYAVAFGIPAAVVYIGAVFLIYLRGAKNRRKLSELNLIGLCCAMFYLVSALFGNSMFYTAPYLFILLGFGYFLASPAEKT